MARTTTVAPKRHHLADCCTSKWQVRGSSCLRTRLKRHSIPRGLRKPKKKIKKYRAFDELFFGQAPFQHLVPEIADDLTGKGMPAVRWQMMAVKRLQEEKEYFICELLRDAQMAAQHAKRVTITDQDLSLAVLLRGLCRNRNLLQELKDTRRLGQQQAWAPLHGLGRRYVRRVLELDS